MLELNNIRKSYQNGVNKQEVLKNINIKFRKSEFVSILGASGSGKTTLLNIIGGLDKYDSGDLIIDGLSTKKYKDGDWDTYRNARVGFVFQNYNLIMHQTVFSNIEMALTLSGISIMERRRRTFDIIEKVGLEEHTFKKPNQLSGGQMQRVAIARALINNPDILLADEPTGALDSKTSTQIMDLLKIISKDRLVIMVTHNAELASKYSTRIIQLKDGVITNDTNSCLEEKDKFKNKEIKKKSMSLITSFVLSFNNLLTKKGRTVLTAMAGSIGIIGIALILALSNGVANYVSKMEKDSLSDYPIKIERSGYDVFGMLDELLNSANEGIEYKDGKLYSKDDLVGLKISSTEGVLKKNNLVEFKKYIESNTSMKKYLNETFYQYDLELQVYTSDYNKVNPSKYKIGENNIFSELEQNEEVLNKKYELLQGDLPKNSDEVVLVVGTNNIVEDSILYSLGIKSEQQLKGDLEKRDIDEKYKVKSDVYSYDDLIGKKYKVILNTDYYVENDNGYIDNSNNEEYMKNKIDNGKEIKIVGILRGQDVQNSFIGYNHGLTLDIIKEISKTDIYKKQVENKAVDVLTGKEFDNINNTYDDLTKKLGIFEEENPSSINIYPKNYENKEEIINAIDEYNMNKLLSSRNDLVINYSDVMKEIVKGIKNVINIVSIILVGFVAISLLVSSIMIAIITYISVLERIKEIGVLRAIGASKVDIAKVFLAETTIEGAVAGIMGIVITAIISAVINVTVKASTNIDNIANLPTIAAFILILLSIIINVIAGIIPSIMASRKNPVEALRSE